MEVITNDYPEALILFPTDLTCPQSHVYNVGHGMRRLAKTSCFLL
jgi:hypothetical protein